LNILVPGRQYPFWFSEGLQIVVRGLWGAMAAQAAEGLENMGRKLLTVSSLVVAKTSQWTVQMAM